MRRSKWLSFFRVRHQVEAKMLACVRLSRLQVARSREVRAVCVCFCEWRGQRWRTRMLDGERQDGKDRVCVIGQCSCGTSGVCRNCFGNAEEASEGPRTTSNNEAERSHWLSSCKHPSCCPAGCSEDRRRPPDPRSPVDRRCQPLPLHRQQRSWQGASQSESSLRSR